MPGRLSSYTDKAFKEDVEQTLGSFKDEVQNLVPNYNIAPTISVPILTNTRRYTYAHFGLIPSWAKEKRKCSPSFPIVSAWRISIFVEMNFGVGFPCP